MTNIKNGVTWVGEVVHLVVEDDAGGGGHDLRPEDVVDGAGDRHRAARPVHHRQVRRAVVRHTE